MSQATATISARPAWETRTSDVVAIHVSRAGLPVESWILSERELPGVVLTARGSNRPTILYGAGSKDTYVCVDQLRGGALPFTGDPLVSRHRSPTWLRSVESRINELLNLPENWDSYGAEHIHAETAEKALQVLEELADWNTPDPSVVPTNRGGVQFEWHTRGIDFEIQFDPSGEIRFCFENPAREGELQGVLTFNDYTDLVPLMRNLHLPR